MTRGNEAVNGINEVVELGEELLCQLGLQVIQHMKLLPQITSMTNRETDR